MPVLPRICHRLAMAVAQIAIGDPVLVRSGVYLVHGQIVIDGITEIGQGAVIAPFYRRPQDRRLPRPHDRQRARIGTGARVLGPVDRRGGARRWARTAVVLSDIPAGRDGGRGAGAAWSNGRPPLKPDAALASATSQSPHEPGQVTPLPPRPQPAPDQRPDRAADGAEPPNPDPEIERKLLNMRHRAFTELDRRRRRRARERDATATGRFAVAQGLPVARREELDGPEMRAAILTPAACTSTASCRPFRPMRVQGRHRRDLRGLRDRRGHARPRPQAATASHRRAISRRRAERGRPPLPLLRPVPADGSATPSAAAATGTAAAGRSGRPTRRG